MSMFKETKEMIDATIYENGNGEITAQNVNLAMHGMLDAVETEVEAVKDKVAEIEENGVGGDGSEVANVYLPTYADLTDDELAKNRDAFEKMKNGAPVQFVISQDGSYFYVNHAYQYRYLSEDDIVAFVVDYDVIHVSETTITSIIHKQDWYVMYSDGSVILEISASEEPSTPASSGPFKLWYSPVVELTEKQINDNKASYNEIRNGGAIDSVYYIAEEGVIGYLRLLMTGLEGGIVAVVAADIVIGPNGEVTAETIDLELSEDGTVTLIPKPAQ